MTFRQQSYTSTSPQGAHQISYSEWGDANTQIIICVHGLTGNGRDFVEIAPALVALGYRVIAPDLPGRGLSDFLEDPADYTYAQYLQTLNDLFGHLNITQAASIDWLGVSLGGLLGMRLAADTNSPIRRIILNDVGPFVPKAALDFIGMVIAQEYRFPSVRAMEQRMRETRGLTWGPITDAQWKQMAADNARLLDDGSVTYRYDPKIAVMFRAQPLGEVCLWHCWDSMTQPVLTLWGKKSVLLTADIIDEMHARGPAMHVVAFDDCGHVPSLMAPEHIQAVTDWLVTF